MSRAVWTWRLAVPLGGLAALALFAALYREVPGIYSLILTAWGVVPFRFPFLDTHAVLSALECARQGLDPYQANPCDVLTEAFVYSPLILEVSALPVTMAWNNPTGVTLALIFFFAVASLPAPRGANEWAVTILALLSTMCVFALERGNIDLAIFALIVVAGHLLGGRPTMRAGAYLIVLFGVVLKYYPLLALFVALRERSRRLLAVAIVTVATLLLFVVYYRRGLEEAMTRVPSGSYFTDFFGAINLPAGLRLLLSPAATASPLAAPVVTLLPWLIGAGLVASCLGRAIAVARSEVPLGRIGAIEADFLILGAALIAGCFFVGQSLDYRGIFFLLLLPGLMALRRAGGGAIFFRTAIMIVFLMWGEMFRQALQRAAPDNANLIWQTAKAASWLFRELVWWRVVGVLVGILICFARTSPPLAPWWPRRRERVA